MTSAPVPLPAPFTWLADSIALDLPGGHIRFTMRLTDATGPGLRCWDGRQPCAAVDAIAASAGIPASRVAQSHQVHQARIRAITREDDLEAAPGDYDGQVTTLTDVVCVVRAADCLPVALVAREAVGVVHAGWRGLAAGIVQAGVTALRGAGASEIRAAIGPGAGVCCYEARDDVHGAFATYGRVARAGANADLKAVARTILEREGVTEVHDTGLCTQCAPDGLLWSHRRQGDAAGRQGGAVWRS
jgi:hypothetical protein